MALQIESTAFEQGKTIPVRNTCDGADRSPALQWKDAPAGTKSFALICDDPDAPVGDWVHWVLYNIAPSTHELPEGVALPDGATQGMNDFRRLGYGGPCPPKGPAHRYFFKLYALDCTLTLRRGATKADLEKAMQGHILAQAEMMGTYGR